MLKLKWYIVRCSNRYDHIVSCTAVEGQLYNEIISPNSLLEGQAAEVIRSLLRDADVDFDSTAYINPFSHWHSIELVTEIKGHMYDPPFEQLTIKQRLKLAFVAQYGFGHYGSTKLLDMFVAKIGVEPASDAVAQALCSGEGVMWREIYGIIRIYATSMAKGVRRATLELPKFIAATVSQGVNAHESDSMENFLREHCREDYTGLAGEYTTELVREALNHWLTALSIAGIDIRMFWEARCKLAKSDDTGVEFEAWDRERGFIGFQMLVYEYGPLLEDWRVDFSWKLNPRQIPEKAAGDFWEMLNHPERQMAGAWDDSWEDRSSDEHLWDILRRGKPSRNWIKSARQLSSERLELLLRWFDSACGMSGWVDDCLDCTEYCDSVEWFEGQRPY